MKRVDVNWQTAGPELRPGNEDPRLVLGKEEGEGAGDPPME